MHSFFKSFWLCKQTMTQIMFLILNVLFLQICAQTLLSASHPFSRFATHTFILPTFLSFKRD